jgi:hypothetical protein
LNHDYEVTADFAAADAMEKSGFSSEARARGWRVSASLTRLRAEALARGWTNGQLDQLLARWSTHHWYAPESLHELELEVLV